MEDGFQNNLDRATNEVRKWPEWKRTLLGAATPEDARRKSMAADQERNRKIAEALGVGRMIETDRGLCFCVNESDYINDADHPGSLWYAEEIDFSKPEWQIKIQEMVEDGWCSGYGDSRWVSWEYTQERWRKVLFMELPRSWDENSQCIESFSSETWRESNEKALLWLHERKVKNDYFLQ